MMSSYHRSGSSSSFLFSITSCFFFIILVLFSLSSFSSSANALLMTSHSQQCLDLLDLKKGFDLSDASTSLSDWLAGTNCCGWEGVSCDKASGLVVSLDLSERYMGGNIMPSLFNLTSLQTLNLAYNGFNQSAVLLLDFEKLANLTHLNLADCNFSGPIPLSIWNLSELVYLDLSSNHLSGHLPPMLAGSKISTLDLSGCNFSGPMPLSIWNLSELVYLDLSDNYLSGDLPTMPARSKISTLDLSSNYFTGQIPSILGNAHHIISLHLEDNLLTGSIPMYLFTLPILEELYLSDNKLSGQLEEFTKASSILQVVDLGDNNLHGKLPKSLVNLFALTSLDLSSNNFDGSVVGLELFGHLPNLTYLDLSGIDMSISDRIAGSSLLFPSLVSLILQSCNLMAIPSFLKHKKNMDVLDLSNNRINGIIPKWIWSIGSTVNLSCNLFTHIERPHPDPLMMFNSVDLHSNMLQGQIPLLQSQFLDYSNNYFTGCIPFNISAYLLGTHFFSLANNNLTGEVPTSICDTNLKILDLSNNSLSGSIHECLLESLSNLQVLNLRRNQFRGILPRNINSSCSLVIINFYGNKLEGEIPKSLAKCEKLEFLDLGSNKLAGFFPYWLGNLPSLKVLVLRENRFYGYFECPLGASVGNHTFEVLQILDISSNNFTGNLPLDCFTRMKAMMIHREGAGTIGFSYNEQMDPLKRPCLQIYGCSSGDPNNPEPKYYNPASAYYEDLVTVVAKGYKMDLSKIPATTSYIDVSNNRLEGTLPEVIGDLKSLNFLNMSLNAFKGHIPQVFGNLRDLESLDLSGNQLSGEIPNSLTSLTFLSFLNLSNNNLVGRIPQGNQFNTFPNASFEGNPGLCGFPLSRQCVNSTSMEPSTDLNNASPELDMEEIWIWMFRGLGFGVGFALAIFRRLLFTKLKIWYKRRFMNR